MNRPLNVRPKILMLRRSVFLWQNIALRFPKATYMYWQQRFDRVDPDLQIRIAIEDIRKDHPNYGYRRLLPYYVLQY